MLAGCRSRGLLQSSQQNERKAARVKTFEFAHQGNRRILCQATPPSLAWYQVLAAEATMLASFMVAAEAALCMQFGGGSRRSRPGHVARRA